MFFLVTCLLYLMLLFPIQHLNRLSQRCRKINSPTAGKFSASCDQLCINSDIAIGDTEKLYQQFESTCCSILDSVASLKTVQPNLSPGLMTEPMQLDRDSPKLNEGPRRTCSQIFVISFPYFSQHTELNRTRTTTTYVLYWTRPTRVSITSLH